MFSNFSLRDLLKSFYSKYLQILHRDLYYWFNSLIVQICLALQYYVRLYLESLILYKNMQNSGIKINLQTQWLPECQNQKIAILLYGTGKIKKEMQSLYSIT